jgi:hypothetical protein
VGLEKERLQVTRKPGGATMHHLPTSDFDDLIGAPIGERGHLSVEIGLDEGVPSFENQDLSSFTFGDEEFAGIQSSEVLVESVGKESTGKFMHIL